MSFKINSLYLSDGYKVGHKVMLAPGTTKLYGTWIPRALKYAPKGITKIVSFGQQLTWKWIHDEFEENFFSCEGVRNSAAKLKALQFVKDVSLYLGMEYDGKHFEELWDLGYLPIKVKALPEGIETEPNIPHMTFIPTVDGYAWLTLYMETLVSNLAWKPAYAATVAKLYRRVAEEWVMKTDPANMWLVDYMCHDFSARGLSGPHDMVSVGLGHATSFRGSDTLIAIPAARYYYNEPENEVCINSVNASEHSVTCTGIFYYKDLLESGKLDREIKHYYSFDVPADGSVEEPDYLAIAELLNLRDWLQKFPKGILSVVSDTFDLWKLITYILPRLSDEILARDGKIVIRPDSGDPVAIICGWKDTGYTKIPDGKEYTEAEHKGVIELLWDVFGGTINEQGYKILDPHIGAIYGDSITPERQVEIYSRLADKGFSATNIVLGVGSFTYEYTTRDWASMVAKGSWFEVESNENKGGDIAIINPQTKDVTYKRSYNIYKDPVTDDGTKKSLKGLLCVHQTKDGLIFVQEECTPEEEAEGLLQIIYEDGKFYNLTTLTEIRKRLKNE
jgi:nicotinamide phosphoribosyltransferase